MLQILVRPRSEFSHSQSEISDKSSDISDAMRLVRLAAEPRHVGDSAKAAIGRAARFLGWSFNRTRDLWYGQARRVEVCEMDALRALEQQRDMAELDAERRKHFEQLAALRARLSTRDAEFHRGDIEAIDWLLKRGQ